MNEAKAGARQTRSRIKRVVRRDSAIIQMNLSQLEYGINQAEAGLRKIRSVLNDLNLAVKGQAEAFIGGMAKRSRHRKGGLL